MSVPKIILDRLARVRAKESAVGLAWGAGRVFGLAVAALVLFGLLDWIVDRRTDTPGALRLLFLLAHLGLWASAGWLLVVRPLLGKRDERDLALWVEDHFRELGHRVITAVELNRPGAPVEGMSAELIAAVTRQAEERAAATDFTSKVLLNRWQRADGALAAGLGLALIFLLAAPGTVGAVLARQFLADREIPRSVQLAVEKEHRVAPSGEELVLRFRATGAEAGWKGEVRVYPEGRSVEIYPLLHDKTGFAATIPPAALNFAYRAWLGDGRTRRPAKVDYEPRPVVKKIDAWVLLPKYVGERPDGKPYEQFRARGEIAAPKGSSARVVFEVQKPIARGVVELLSRAAEAGNEPVLRRVDAAIRKEGREGEATFDLRPDEITYRIVVEDRHGFANSTPPRRGISIVPDEPPRVVLLPERLILSGEEAVSEETEIEGAPVPLGSVLRVAYYCAHPYGLDRSRLLFRVIKAGQASGEALPAAAEADWKILPLGEVRQTEESGPFDLRRGAFRNSGIRDAVEFHPMPSPDPERVPSRLEGGGCFDFQTRALPGLKVGDQIEFLVEAFARNPDLDKQPGRSETRLKAFVTGPQYLDWVLQTLKHESRVRQLESRQRGVFAPEGADR